MRKNAHSGPLWPGSQSKLSSGAILDSIFGFPASIYGTPIVQTAQSMSFRRKIGQKCKKSVKMLIQGPSGPVAIRNRHPRPFLTPFSNSPPQYWSRNVGLPSKTSFWLILEIYYR